MFSRILTIRMYQCAHRKGTWRVGGERERVRVSDAFDSVYCTGSRRLVACTAWWLCFSVEFFCFALCLQVKTSEIKSAVCFFAKRSSDKSSEEYFSMAFFQCLINAWCWVKWRDGIGIMCIGAGECYCGSPVKMWNSVLSGFSFGLPSSSEGSQREYIQNWSNMILEIPEVD
jgi:hypothetical protein